MANALESAAVILARHTIFEPIVTGAALWAITRGPPELNAYAPDLSKLPVSISKETITFALKILLGLGLVRYFSNFMNRLSFGNWQLFYSGAPWVWKKEIMVVTGGAGGIASATIEKLLPTGMTVAVLDLFPPRKAILNNPNVHFYKVDLTSFKAIKEAADKIKKELGTPTILINNAGLGIGKPIIQETDEELEKIFRVNLMCQWITVREFLPGMIKAKKGHIMTVASMASFVGVAGIVDYCATKAGALAFHEGLTQEIRHLYKAPFISTTCVHPHWVKTLLTAPIQDGIKLSDNLMTPEYVGGIMAKAILSGRGGHMYIPPNAGKLKVAGFTRGLPAWVQSIANDTTKGSALHDLSKGELKEAERPADY